MMSAAAPGMETPAESVPVGSVSVKVAWLKQKKDEGSKLPLLDFDELQHHVFERRRTTFRMVKHSCSYPAPPHKVRMWCSSLGASPDLPSTMDLNAFINTFELITEEKHTLEMAHLTGGETIAFEMVQGEQASELSTFLLGAQLKQPPKVVTVDKKSLKDTLNASVQKLADELEAGRSDLSAALGVAGAHAAPILTLEEQARIATVLREQAVAAEVQRRKLADELIAEEEEEARRREKKKAKKRGKKEKQKEKKKAQVGRLRPLAQHPLHSGRANANASARARAAGAAPRARTEARPPARAARRPYSPAPAPPLPVAHPAPSPLSAPPPSLLPRPAHPKSSTPPPPPRFHHTILSRAHTQPAVHVRAQAGGGGAGDDDDDDDDEKEEGGEGGAAAGEGGVGRVAGGVCAACNELGAGGCSQPSHAIGGAAGAAEGAVGGGGASVGGACGRAAAAASAAVPPSAQPSSSGKPGKLNGKEELQGGKGLAQAAALNGHGGGGRGGSGGGGGACTSERAENIAARSNAGARSKLAAQGASNAGSAARAADASPTADGAGGDEEGSDELHGLVKLVQLGVAAKAAEDDTQLREAWGALPDPVARHLQGLQQQVGRRSRHYPSAPLRVAARCRAHLACALPRPPRLRAAAPTLLARCRAHLACALPRPPRLRAACWHRPP